MLGSKANIRRYLSGEYAILKKLVDENIIRFSKAIFCKLVACFPRPFLSKDKLAGHLFLHPKKLNNK